MRLYLRLLWLIITQSRRPRCNLLGPVETTLRVFPNDLDVFLHVNNGVYLSYADLGRTDLMLRSGSFHKFRQRGWYPVVANAAIVFKQSLTLGQAFSVNTRVVGWSNKAIYIQQDFTSRGRLVAQLMLDGRLLARTGGKVAISDVLQLVDISQPSPELPEKFKLWLASTELPASSGDGDDPRPGSP